jgi:hypothetical protein
MCGFNILFQSYSNLTHLCMFDGSRYQFQTKVTLNNLNKKRVREENHEGTDTMYQGSHSIVHHYPCKCDLRPRTIE